MIPAYSPIVRTVEIPLAKGEMALVDSDAPRAVFQINWYRSPRDSGLEYVQGVFRKSIDGGHGRAVYMHRFVLAAPKGAVVDHINGNGLDNRRANLQFITQSRNCMKSCKALGTGAHFDTHLNRWRGQLRIDGKKIELGLFATKEEALAAVTAKRRAAWSNVDWEWPELTPP